MFKWNIGIDIGIVVMHSSVCVCVHACVFVCLYLKPSSLAKSLRNSSKLPSTSVDVAALLPPVPPPCTSPDFECSIKGTSLSGIKMYTSFLKFKNTFDLLL